MLGHPTSPQLPHPSRRLLLGYAAGSALLTATAAAVPGAQAAAQAAPSRSAFASADTPDRPPMPGDAQAAAAIRAEYLHSWYGYTAHAWGYDELRPLSGGHNDFFADGHSFGLSMVEALDTLYLMGCDRELASARSWVEDNLDPTQDVDIHVFEAIIRLVGGLVAGYLTTRSDSLLGRAQEFADRLLPAFTSSPTGIPYTHVNLRTGQVRGHEVALAEAGTNIMEFGALSALLGDPRYYDAAMRAYRAVLSRRSSLDLLGTTIDAEKGRWVDDHSTAPNPPVDSFYEYLWGGGRLLGDGELTHWYHTLTRAVLAHQSDRRDGHPWYHTVDASTGARTGPTHQSELAAFYAGLLGKGGDVPRGAAYFDSWTAVLDRYPVLPETIDYTDLSVVDQGSQLRPEYANSAFDLWRLTGDARYKQAMWRWFDRLRTHLRVPGGYTVADEVTPTSVRLDDLTPGYWFAENLKYAWLVFSRTPRFDYRNGVLSTEGKVLAGAL
ncbi:glycoside hydrolase family 47 protein [Streptacidiphilus jiangxiensis]|uniref:Mannosyl-oligosaccharide alpha-1,2-mannosidase n=1 Tax=Streptacidiphilus jiangxiensis TaxID=235985 RepID=A0A1H7I305_STRJI|nr:glycoside hydrolase family 47 protein [Streptacidiphilus jiangxiensis]SEK56973.1 mannosyl-oligosaccharide alpha-1,2-mannosidase [Streptacidiphilus jiangxiensis]